MERNTRTENKASGKAGKVRNPRKKGSAGKEKYYAFFDAEYTCYMDSDRGFDRKHSSEVLSVGLVITDKQFNVAATYYSPIRPHYNPKLTGYCRKLTGLTQKEIDEAPSYETVFQKIDELLQEYPVKELFVWGNDNRTLLDDAERNHRMVSKRTRKIINKVKDLTKRLTMRVFDAGMTVSLSDMKYICDMDHCTAHNAFDDAMDLYQVTRCCVQGTYNKQKAKRLFDYIHERNTYHQYRRFKYPDKKVSVISDKKLKQKTKEYITVLKEVYSNNTVLLTPELRALCDDVRSLAAMCSEDCPKLEEE